ncbi:hypothetical protein L1987_68661 [Smallanthus sonchifolius]|uniref:Uncharacterized protein n=1 Tax=Smallanthus sonchifolius TaxID=185202 RepID=A0ACB9B4S2_9ASTR|nr:hypothetical protein L1987_68661 [Smallanthus sonchifolius]
MGKQESKQGDTFSYYQLRYQKMVQGYHPNSMKLASFKGGYVGKRHTWIRKHFSSIVFTVALIGFLFLLDSLMSCIFEPSVVQSNSMHKKLSSDMMVPLKFGEHGGKSAVQMYDRLASMASSALVEVCNAVAVASLLNATLVIPRFLFSNVWKDPSQFGDIYQEDYFMKTLKDEVNIITDADISKEATPTKYIEKVLPILSNNGVVHFLGYGNRLGFDPLPSELQRLRCKCNYHALKFVPKIQETGSLFIRRIRKYDGPRNKLDKQLLGNFITGSRLRGPDMDREPLKYIALHMRFEVDMVAYSLCEFGGGQVEKTELQAYREAHFPLLVQRLKQSKAVSAEELRRSGRCPLTPEEAALVLAALGFTSETYIYLAGSQIYGGKSRMQPLTNLYPKVITKEDLLSPTELAPFKNFSSQLAALDLIACATADVFAITDSGSQLSSLVSGFRTYYGGAHAPTLRPSKKRLAEILSKNQTIIWKDFEAKVTKMVSGAQSVRLRGWGRSIYRQPRCPECMCMFQ